LSGIEHTGKSSDGGEFSKIKNSPREDGRLNILKGHGIAHRQTVTTLGAPTGENCSAILARHARTKAVLVYSFTIAGLKGSFHDEKSNFWLRGSI
jgi:hypothetical protein